MKTLFSLYETDGCETHDILMEGKARRNRQQQSSADSLWNYFPQARQCQDPLLQSLPSDVVTFVFSSSSQSPSSSALSSSPSTPTTRPCSPIPPATKRNREMHWSDDEGAEVTTPSTVVSTAPSPVSPTPAKPVAEAQADRSTTTAPMSKPRRRLRLQSAARHAEQQSLLCKEPEADVAVQREREADQQGSPCNPPPITAPLGDDVDDLDLEDGIEWD